MVELLGRPNNRNEVASRFRAKTRRKEDTKRKRGILTNESSSGLLSGTTEISGHPSSNEYDLGDFGQKFDPNKKVVVIVHGWSIMNPRIEETYQGKTRQTVELPNWVFLLQDRILQVDDVNVVVHDWRGGAQQGYRYDDVISRFMTSQ